MGTSRQRYFCLIDITDLLHIHYRTLKPFSIMVQFREE